MDSPKRGQSEKSLTKSNEGQELGRIDSSSHIPSRMSSVTVAGIHGEISWNGSFRHVQLRERRFGTSMRLNCDIEIFPLFTSFSCGARPSGPLVGCQNLWDPLSSRGRRYGTPRA